MTDPDPVADLAAQLEELRANVSRLQGIVASWDARLEREGIGGTLMLRLEVKRLTERLNDALAKRQLAPPPAPWWCTDENETRSMLAELRHWIEGFARKHYPAYMARLRACWPNHPEAMWELSTLMAEWERVYGDADNRDLAGALWWHERWLPGVIARLDKAITCDEAGCRRAPTRRS
jgi:hypothetical protein